jgi:hypothetical protein
MSAERGQGTVEYVGVLLVVAVLLGAIVSAVGMPGATAGLASSFVRALSGAFGVGTAGRTDVTPSASEEALYARATDGGVAPDDRPSLRDVRLDLIAAHGDERGRAIYRELMLEGLRRVVPGLGAPTRFGTIDRDASSFGYSSVDQLTSRLRALSQPAGDDPGELETPVGEPDAHVVSEAEQDDAFRHALHPDGTWRSLALDGVSMIPLVGTARAATRIAITTARGIATLASALGAAGDAVASLSPSAQEIPPGSRAGDEIVTWSAIRRRTPDAPPVRVDRAAIVRDGVVLSTSVELAPRVAP